MDADILPDFSLDVDVNVTVSGDAWQLVSTTNVGVLPSFGGTKRLALLYDLDFVEIGASAAFALLPLGFTQADVYGKMVLLDGALGEGEPDLLLSSDLRVGSTLNAAVDPYATAVTKLTVGDHWLSNTTTVTFIPSDVTSTLLGHIAFGAFEIADGAVTVTTYGYVSLDLVPFGFSYVQANADISVDSISIDNTVTYYGGTWFSAESSLTIDLEPLAIAIWGSFDSMASDPFGLGINASVEWEPLSL